VRHVAKRSTSRKKPKDLPQKHTINIHIAQPNDYYKDYNTEQPKSLDVVPEKQLK
jgi:hypothetical protein